MLGDKREIDLGFECVGKWFDKMNVCIWKVYFENNLKRVNVALPIEEESYCMLLHEASELRSFIRYANNDMM
jgi:hypothetical protein